MHDFATKNKTRAKNRELREKAYAVYLSSVPKEAPKSAKVAGKMNCNNGDNFMKPVGKVSERILREMDAKRSFRPTIDEKSKNIVDSKVDEYASDLFSRSQKYLERKEEWLEREKLSQQKRELQDCSFAPEISIISSQLHMASLSLSDYSMTKGGAGGGGDILDRHIEWKKRRDQKIEKERLRKLESETDGCTFRPKTSYSHPKTKVSQSAKYKVDGGLGSSSSGKRQQKRSVDDSSIPHANSSAHSSYSLMRQLRAPGVEIDYVAAAEAQAWSWRRPPLRQHHHLAETLSRTKEKGKAEKGKDVLGDYTYREVDDISRYGIDEETFAHEYEKFLLSEAEAEENLRELREFEGSAYDELRPGPATTAHYEHIDDGPDDDRGSGNRHTFDDYNNSSLTNSSGLDRSNSMNEESADLFNLARMDSGALYGGEGRKRRSVNYN